MFQAKETTNQFKILTVREVGANLTNDYNGHLVSWEAGSVCGQMIKKCIPYES